MSEFIELTGLEPLEDSLLTPVEKWQVLKVLIEQEETRLDRLKKLAAEFEQVVIDQFDAMEDYAPLKQLKFGVYQKWCPNCEQHRPGEESGENCTNESNIQIPAATIYQALRGHVRVAETPAAIMAMRAAGYGNFIVQKVDQEKFGKLYKETLEADNDFQFPDILQDHVKVYQRYELRQRINKK